MLSRIMLEAGRPQDALTNSAQLDALSGSSSDTIATIFLRGEILERLNQPAAALAEYQKNLTPALPPEVNRKALAKIMSLAQPGDAIPQLDTIIARRPADPNLDLALWYRGDLYLKSYFGPTTPDTNAPAPGNTNDLQAAMTNLTWLVQNFTNSEVLGKAALDLGWADWTQEKFADAKTNFLLAVTHLPYSADGAVALLKLGDAEFKQGDFSAAARDYNQLLTDYATLPAITNQLFASALYQLVQTDINLRDEKDAEQAADRLLDSYRDSGFGASSLLLLGENSDRLGNFARAREIFSNLLAAYPDTRLQPKIQFEIARTYEHEGDWSNAVRACEIWLANTNFATNDLLPEVAFTRAIDTGKAGQETNAFALMTNYLTQFQTNSLASNTFAPLAQFWIGDYDRNHGENGKAYYAYDYLWVTFPAATNLIPQARLMAGRAAETYDLPQASNEFYVLTEYTNTPASILGEAWFQLGFTDFLQFQASRPAVNRTLFDHAVGALEKATNAALYPALAPEALGQLGNCWLAWAPLDTNSPDKAADYLKAAQMYQDELNLPQSDVTARSQAEFGLGLVEQGRHHPDDALNHFLKVVFPPSEVVDETKEKPDPVWVKEAGVAAWQMCEDNKDFTAAENIYERVKAVVPTLGGEMEEKKLATSVGTPSASGK
jgi:tetratricopeptide (TPR) repeat protein